jgi:hypothetical protein
MIGEEFDILASRLADGNTAASSICNYLWAYARRCDPDTEDHCAVMRILDEHNIRAERLVILLRHVCNDCYVLVMSVAHGLEFGYLAALHVNAAIDRDVKLNFIELKGQLQRDLPNFPAEMH